MKPIEFKEQTNILAKDQPEYIPLPINMSKDGMTITSCWELDENDIDDIRRTGKIWLQILTFGEMLQPQLLSINKPEMEV